MSLDERKRGDVAWSPHLTPQLQKLAKSFSTDNLNVSASLDRVSSTLNDVRRNGETLLLTANSQLQKLKAPLEVRPIRRSSVSEQSPNPIKSLRKSSSESNVQIAAPRTSRSLRRGVSRLRHTSVAPLDERLSDTWLEALNNTVSQAKSNNLAKLPQLPSRKSFESQAKQLVTNASALNVQLPQKAREALSTAQQTLDTCGQNLVSLQQNLHQSFSESRMSLEQKLQATQADLQLRLQQSNSAELHQDSSVVARLLSLARGDSDSNVDANAWGALLPALRSGRQIKSVESLPDDSDADSSPDAAKPWGPFQREAAKRRATKKSSLRDPDRKLTIVTTAALPWMTGTAVNPLLRAAYLSKDADRDVTLLIPWLAASDQAKVFPNGMNFESPEEQEVFVRKWALQRTGFSPNFKVKFYPGRYAPEKCSILPVGDPTAYVADSDADVAILEEPEHLTWYHAGRRWTDKFNHVVGVVHTNYLDYARREQGGDTKEYLLKHINSLVTRAHCHRVVKLSDAVQKLPREMTQFVHGVAENFLKVGEAKALQRADGNSRFQKGAYFIGKAVWAKGYGELLDLVDKHTHMNGRELLEVDCYGAGEDLEAVKDEGSKRQLKLKFHGARDHADASIHDYRVFINPSTSDVVATTTAEALAMGKWVVCADHPSNRFFSQFSNCLIYKTPEEFSSHVEYALSHDPKPLPADERAQLTWEAATERFLDATELSESHLKPPLFDAAVDTALYAAHSKLCAVEPLRALAGAGSNTRDNPNSITDYVPAEEAIIGLFDDKKRVLTSKTNQKLDPVASATVNK